MMERLVEAYRMRAGSSVKAKLAVLMHLGQLDDPRVVPFLLTVLGDSREAEEVRIYVLKEVRNGLVRRRTARASRKPSPMCYSKGRPLSSDCKQR
jgi:hypothetical protein